MEVCGKEEARTGHDLEQDEEGVAEAAEVDLAGDAARRAALDKRKQLRADARVHAHRNAHEPRHLQASTHPVSAAGVT